MSGCLTIIDRLERGPFDRSTPALIEAGGASVTRQALIDRARATARGMIAAGMRPGDRVLFAVRSSIASILLIIAVTEAGGVIVPADPGMGDELFAQRIAMIEPRWVIAESLLLAASASRLATRLLRRRGVKLLPFAKLRAARFVRVGFPLPAAGRALDWRALERDGARVGAAVALPAKSPDDEAFIVFTSGTTGAPRAVVHTQRSLRATLDIVGAQLAIGESDVLYARELHLILPALFAGARVVIPSRGNFSAARVLRDIARFGATHTFAVTAECRELLDVLMKRGERMPGSLRQIMIGAAPVHATFLRRLRDVLPATTTAWCVYGMSEVLPVACVTHDEKVAYTGDGDLLGPPLPGVEARVSDDGELLLRGPNLFRGYLGEPPVTEHATGDLARIHGSRIILLGRRKDMIIRGQHNIYPALYEPTIERIAGVRRAAMVGVFDDAISDERVAVVVEPEHGVGEDALIERVRRELRSGPFRIDDTAQPDLVLAMPLPEHGRSSKIDKEALRKIVAERLACASR